MEHSAHKLKVEESRACYANYTQTKAQTPLFSGTYRQFSEPLWNLGHIDKKHAKENTNTLETENVEVQ